MNLIAKKPNKKFDNNFVGTSVLDSVLQSNYRATVLWGMLTVVFARRLRFINSGATEGCEVSSDAGVGRMGLVQLCLGSFLCFPSPRTVWPLLLPWLPWAPRPLPTRRNMSVVKHQGSGEDGVWEAPMGSSARSRLTHLLPSFPLGSGCRPVPVRY